MFHSKIFTLRELWESSHHHFKIIAFILYFVFGALAVVINLIELTILLRKPKRTNFEIILTSLASADLLSGLSSIASGIIVKYSSITSYGLSAKIYVAVLMHALSLSLGHAFIITIDRFIAVSHPITYCVLIDKRKIVKAIVVWWFTTVCSSVIFVQIKEDLLVTQVLCSFVILEGIIIVILYCLLIRRMPRNSKSLASRSFQQQPLQHRCMFSVLRTQHERLIVMNGKAVCVLFVLFNFPLSFHIIIASPCLFFLTHALPFFNNIFNPVVYFLVTHFRRRTNRRG